MTDATALARVLELAERDRFGAAPRLRAQRRPGGKRTTLTIPAELIEAAEVLARRAGTTPNDVLVRAMIDGIVAQAREDEIARIADERGRALLARLADLPSRPTPTEEEHVEAALALRNLVD